MSRGHSRRSLCVAVTSILGMFGASSVLAQQIEEILVTARKVEESLQDAPVAVSAFTSATIEQRGITGVDDIARFTPGLSFSQAFGRNTDRPVVRGQSNVLAGVQFGVESGTAYFIDGVYYPGDIQALDFNSLERVEVVKGPQSALYGRNTYAGAINFITKDPTNELSGSVEATVAEFEEYEVSGSLSGALIDDKLLARINLRHYEYGGEYRNTLTGDKVGQEETDSAALTLVWNASENFTVRSNTIYREDDDGPLALFLQGAAANNCSPGFRSAANRRQLLFLPVTPFLTSTNGNQYYCGEIAPAPIALNTDTLDLPAPGGLFNPPPIGPRDGTAFDGVETQEWFTSLKLDWDIGGSGWVLTSTSGYRDYVNLFGTDSDHSDAFAIGAIPSFFPPPPRVVGYAPGEPLFANTNRNDIVDYSSELRIASPVDRRLRGVLGLYYYDQKDEGRDLTFEYPRRAELENESFTENQAIFGLLAYDITDRLTATVEIRYAEETKERDDYCDSLAGCTNTQFGDVGFGEKIFSAEETFTATDPRVTIDYQVTPDALLYGVYAKGSKPGGINGSVGLPVDAVFYEQEESDNFELGAKVSGLDGRVQFNTALFYIDATDVQLTTALPATTGQGAVNSVATNQGAAEIKGLEIDMQALLTDNLVLGLGYAYTNAKFTEGCDDFEHVLNTGGVIIDFANLTPEAREACDISGNRLPLGSEHQANATLDWVVPFGSSGYEFVSNLNATYESSKFVQVHNLAETGDATIVGLRLGVRSPSGWQVTAWGRNLTDEDTIPLATRWFDLRYGFANTAPPGTAGTSPGLLDSGLPRAFFGALRKGRTFGVDFRYEF